MNNAPFTLLELRTALVRADGNITETARILRCDRGTVRKYKEEMMGVTRYVITNAVNNTKVFEPFWQSLQRYCELNDAILLVIPSLYKNPNAMQMKDPVWYTHEILPFICKEERQLNESVYVLGDLPIQPTASDPLSALEPHAKGKWAIIGHPQVAMKMIPGPIDHTPPMLHTTGSCCEKNYSKSKLGKKAELHHTYGATVVECVGDYAHVRELIADDSGVFYDVAGGVKRYTPKGVDDVAGVDALITGDEHIAVASERVMKSTYLDQNSLVAVAQPREIYRHDVLDFYARNHHHTDPIQNFVKFLKGADDVRAELEQTLNFVVNTTPEDAVSYVVASNHHEALDRWIREADPRRDPKNAPLLHELNTLVYREAEKRKDHRVNSFELFAREILNIPERVQFLSRTKSHYVGDIIVSFHGDKGSGGTRGSLATFSKIANKAVIGHIHGPGINKGAWATGYSADQLDYQDGLSNWFNTHCLVYPNGKRQMIHILADGSWRA